MLRQLISGVSGFMLPTDAAEAVSLNEHGEHGLAFELICTQLYEYRDDAPLPGTVLAEIEACGLEMGMDEELWSFSPGRASAGVDAPPSQTRGATAEKLHAMRASGLPIEHVCEAVVASNLGKIETIRLLREVYGVGLAEAQRLLLNYSSMS